MGLELSGLYPGPYFDLERNHENVSVYVGTHAYLPCYVKQLGNKSVRFFFLFISFPRVLSPGSLL